MKLSLARGLAVPIAHAVNPEPKPARRRTRWFSGKKWQPGPAMVGVWEAKHPTEKRTVCARWDGANWAPYARTADEAASYLTQTGPYQDLQFRGWTTQQE